MEILECDHLEEYRQIAAEQARSAVEEHFKDDFMFKIRSAIREALQRKDGTEPHHQPPGFRQG